MGRNSCQRRPHRVSKHSHLLDGKVLAFVRLIYSLFQPEAITVAVQFLPVRKVVLGLGISLDGYIARRNGAVDFLFMPRDYSMGPFFKSIDVAIMGRKTYEVVMKMGGGGFGGSMISYVLSRSVPPGERDGLIFSNQSPQVLVNELRKQ